jgi:hypothetical protein
MRTQRKVNAPTPMPTSAPTERLGAAVTVAATADVGIVAELVMLICPAVAVAVEPNVVDEGRKEVVVASPCPDPVSVRVWVLDHSSQAETP